MRFHRKSIKKVSSPAAVQYVGKQLMRCAGVSFQLLQLEQCFGTDILEEKDQNLAGVDLQATLKEIKVPLQRSFTQLSTLLTSVGSCVFLKIHNALLKSIKVVKLTQPKIAA